MNPLSQTQPKKKIPTVSSYTKFVEIDLHYHRAGPHRSAFVVVPAQCRESKATQISKVAFVVANS